MQIALMSKQLPIALLLIQNGKANLNAYDLQVYNELDFRLSTFKFEMRFITIVIFNVNLFY